MRPPSLLIRLGRLCIALAAMWLLMHVVTPKLVELVPPVRDYANIVHETGIMPGALFYTDVPQTMDAIYNNRDAIRFFVNRGR